jgi:hypothetical protein
LGGHVDTSAVCAAQVAGQRVARALACLLIAAITLAPIARAACAIDHFTAVPDTVQVDAFVAASDVPASGCCGGQYDTLRQHAKPAASEAVVAPSTPAAQFLLSSVASVIVYPSPPRAAVRALDGRRSSPPPEPAFRQAPKLLI